MLRAGTPSTWPKLRFSREMEWPDAVEALRAAGRHDEALRVLALDARDPTLAEAYCDAHADLGLHARLLRLYLGTAGRADAEGADDADPGELGADELAMLDAAVDLVRRHCARLDTAEPMRMLPAAAELPRLKPALGALLAEAAARRRGAHVQSSLAKARSVQVHARLIEERSRRVTVREDSVCSGCGRRIGTAAFAVLAGGEVAHLSCASAASSPAAAEAPAPSERAVRRIGE